MINKPYFCILLATFNGIKWIEDQISSIINQTNIKLDIYVSDDQSSDGTIEYLQKLNLNNLYLLDTTEKFNIASKNFFRLIKEVNFDNYDYVALCDQDDIWLKEKLFTAYKRLSSNNYNCYSASVEAFWNNGKSKKIILSNNQKKYDYFYESAGPGCTFVLDKESVLDFQFFLKKNWNVIFNEIKVHDWFLYFYMRSKNYSWYIDDKVVARYRQHHSNELGANYGFNGILKRLKMLNYNFAKNHLSVFNDLLPNKNQLFYNYYNKNKLYFVFFFIKNFGKFRRKFFDNIKLLLVVIWGGN